LTILTFTFKNYFKFTVTSIRVYIDHTIHINITLKLETLKQIFLINCVLYNTINKAIFFCELLIFKILENKKYLLILYNFFKL